MAGFTMIRTYEASVLSVEPRGDHQVATLRVQGLGTVAVEVGAGRFVQAGDIRAVAITITLGDLIGIEQQPADHR